jgi:hypothetical protein
LADEDLFWLDELLLLESSVSVLQADRNSTPARAVPVASISRRR